uniref:Uncharacterized protein n=1 Tax=Avena sativa TaxID=4498 RepID=A0ACD5ZY20_AVESA
MKQWKSLVALHSSAHSCFPRPPSTPSPCPSPPRELAEEKTQQAVRLVGCDGQVLTFRRPVTARELMKQHPRHLVCRSDALLIGEKIPAVAPAEELQPGQAYFLLPDHLFHSVLSFVSLASSLILLLSTAPGAGGKKQHRPFELLRTDSGTLQIKFSDDFLVDDDDTSDVALVAKKPAVLGGDDRLEKDYEELVGYGKARRWAPKLGTIEEVVVAAAPFADGCHSRKGIRVLPFLGKLGSRRRRETTTTTTIMCGNGSTVACSG